MSSLSYPERQEKERRENAKRDAWGMSDKEAHDALFEK